MIEVKNEHRGCGTANTFNNMVARRNFVRPGGWAPDAKYWAAHFKPSELKRFVELFDQMAAEADIAGDHVRRDTYRQHVLSVSLAIAKRENGITASASEKPRPTVEQISQSDCDLLLAAK